MSFVIENLKLSYGSKVALDGFSYTINRGEILGIAGESGCGKSTLSYGLTSFLPAGLKRDSGKVLIDTIDLYSLSKEKLRREILGKRVSIIPQKSLNALNPMLRIKAQVFNLFFEHNIEKSKAEIETILRYKFEQIGLDGDLINEYSINLSGGMKQRVVIIISTILNPDLVIADEPTSALDVSTQKMVIQYLKSLVTKGEIGSLIFISHEIPLLYHIADNMIIMYKGEIVETGTTEDVIQNPQKEYTKQLIQEAVRVTLPRDVHNENG